MSIIDKITLVEGEGESQTTNTYDIVDSTAASNIADLQASNNAHNTAIEELQTNVTANTSDIEELKTTVSTNTSDIDSLNSTATSISETITSLQTDVTANRVLIDGLTDDTNTLVSDVADLKTRPTVDINYDPDTTSLNINSSNADTSDGNINAIILNSVSHDIVSGIKGTMLSFLIHQDGTYTANQSKNYTFMQAPNMYGDFMFSSIALIKKAHITIMGDTTLTSGNIITSICYNMTGPSSGSVILVTKAISAVSISRLNIIVNVFIPDDGPILIE